MIFDKKKDALKYIQSILDLDINVVYYRLAVFFDKNSIEVNHINMVEVRGKEELSLVSLDTFNEDETIDITLNSYALMNYLPLLYHKKDFLKRYLFGTQSTLLPINKNIFNIDELFRPERTKYIDWLSSWFGIRYGSLTDEKGKRKIVANAIDLYKSRGTKLYFIKLIKSLIDVDLLIDDNKYSIYNKDRQKYNQNPFTVIISDKLSSNKEEEERKYSIIQNIFEKEKPVNTSMHIVYDYNIDNTKKEKVIIYANDDYDY